MLRIYGTVTSPYVRRVRIVAHEFGLEAELIDTATDPGQAQLRSISPIWKVPVAEIDGEVVFDSAVINELLMRKHGPGPLAPFDSTDIEVRNVISVIDGALDSLINCFYLAKDGVGPGSASYLQKHHDRAASALSWLDARVDTSAEQVSLTRAGGFGLAEIALISALGWMRFRETYPIENHPALLRCLVEQRARPSVVATAPPT